MIKYLLKKLGYVVIPNDDFKKMKAQMHLTNAVTYTAFAEACINGPELMSKLKKGEKELKKLEEMITKHYEV